MSNIIALPGGTELVGDYRIDRVLGAGGFGITYLADELALARAVTIKEYFPSDFAARNAAHEAVPRSHDCSGDYRWGLDRFIEEAQTLARFDHPNIVRVYRYFRANNTGYMVLHFEDGQNLKTWLKGLGRAPRQKELDGLIGPLLDALDFIHKADYLHRDIAPDNIIIRKSGAPVLIDFGSARGEIAAHSKTVSALVKPGYSPYEQYAETSKQQGPWTDIYALGATLYHAVTGRRPPDAPSRMVQDEIVPAREAAISSYRHGFLKAIDRALSLDIKDRPQSIAIWRGELLAPDPPRQGWLPRGAQKSKATEKLPPAPVDGLGSVQPVVAASPAVTVPPPPDVPVPVANSGGGLFDFMERLKGGRSTDQRRADAGAANKAGNPARVQPASAGGDIDVKSRPRNAGEKAAQPRGANAGALGGSGRQAAPLKKAEPGVAPAVPAADEPSPRARPAVVPVKSKAVARVDKPKPMRSSTRRHLRPILVKLAIGAVIAGAAVVIQDRLPELQAQRSETGEVAKPRVATQTRPAPAAANSRVAAAETAAATSVPQLPQIPPIEAHAGGVHQITFTAGGSRLVSIGRDSSLKVWETGSRRLVRSIPLDGGEVTSLAVRGDDALTGHADGQIASWDIASARKRGTFQRNEAAIWALAFIGDGGRFASATHDWKIALWDGNSATSPMHTLDGHTSAVQSIAYSPSAALMASGSADRSVRLWNLATLEMLRSYRGATDFISAVALSVDGKQLAAASLDGSIRVWNTNSKRLKRQYSGHKGAVNSLAFSPDGTRLVSGGDDGTVRLWATDRRRSVRAFAGHRDAVRTVSYAPDGASVASGGADGSIRIWPLLPGLEVGSVD